MSCREMSCLIANDGGGGAGVPNIENKFSAQYSGFKEELFNWFRMVQTTELNGDSVLPGKVYGASCCDACVDDFPRCPR